MGKIDHIGKIDCEWTCYVCSAVCPDSAIECGLGTIEIDLKKCSRCLACISTCPVGKIGESDLVGF